MDHFTEARMNRLFGAVLLILSLAPAGACHASEQSPYKTSLAKECLILGSGFGLAATSEAFRRNADALTASEVENLAKIDINWVDRSAASNWSPDLRNASDVLVGACMASPLALLLSEEIRTDAGAISIICLETIVVSASVAGVLKASGRIRPLAYNPDVSLERKLRLQQDVRASFPSSHTALAFSSAVLLSTIYSDYFPDSKWRPYVWGGSLLVASTVGYLRYASGYHFPTDVLAGAVIGGTVGYLIPYLHRNTGSENMSVRPVYRQGRLQLAFDCRF